MTHTISEKHKLLARVRRMRGQIEGIERAINGEAGCEQILHLLVRSGVDFGPVLKEWTFFAVARNDRVSEFLEHK